MRYRTRPSWYATKRASNCSYSESRAPSGPRRGDGGCGGDSDECGQPHFYEIEDHERQDTRRKSLSGGEAGYHGQPGSSESVDDRKARASPEEAGPKRLAAGGSRDGVGGNTGYRRGYGVGDQ